MIPKYFFFTKGVGKHKEQLQSFELALRDAGIQMCNLVAVSSIVPPGCEQVTREKGLKMIHPGEITFVVIDQNLVGAGASGDAIQYRIDECSNGDGLSRANTADHPKMRGFTVARHCPWE